MNDEKPKTIKLSIEVVAEPGIKYSFADVVRYERQRLGLSQEQLSEWAEVCRNLVSAIEVQKANPTLKTMQSILAKTDYELVFVPTNILVEFEKFSKKAKV